MGLVDPAREVLVVGEKLLEINDVFIKESTSDNWSELVAENSLDGFVDVISHKCSSVVALKLVKLANVNLWQVQHLWILSLWRNWLIHVHLLLCHWILPHVWLLTWLLALRKLLIEDGLLLLVAH